MNEPDQRLTDASPQWPDLHWPEVRDWLRGHGDRIAADPALLAELGLVAAAPNVAPFMPAALTRLEHQVEQEAGARKQVEAVARANFAAQTQTHVAVLDLMEARSHSDLARRLDAAVQARFGLSGAVIGLEKPGPVPFGWKALEPRAVDSLVGADGLAWLGPNFDGLNLFGAADDQVESVALVRMGLWAPTRPAICAFGSPEPEGFTPAMGCELVSFLTRVVERMAERWPVLD